MAGPVELDLEFVFLEETRRRRGNLVSDGTQGPTVRRLPANVDELAKELLSPAITFVEGRRGVSPQIRVYSPPNIVVVFSCIPTIHTYFTVFWAD